VQRIDNNDSGGVPSSLRFAAVTRITIKNEHRHEFIHDIEVTAAMDMSLPAADVLDGNIRRWDSDGYQLHAASGRECTPK
jgi:hypothetical protein